MTSLCTKANTIQVFILFQFFETFEDYRFSLNDIDAMFAAFVYPQVIWIIYFLLDTVDIRAEL